MGLYSWPVKYVARKVFGDVEIGNSGEDPFFEEVEFEKKSFWSGSSRIVRKKRDKSIPPFIPEADRWILKKVRKRAYRLDLAFHLCGVRFGWLGIIGILPVIGDFLVLYLSLMVYREALKVTGGLPTVVTTQMLSNIAIDFGLGLIPIVGDIIGVCYKANSRNVLILEKHLKHRYNKVQIPRAK